MSARPMRRVVAVGVVGVCTVVLVLVLLLWMRREAPPSARVHTLVTAPRGIVSFAQDADTVAWSSIQTSGDPERDWCPAVSIRDVRSGRTSVVWASSGDECQDVYERLAVAGPRFVLGYMGSCCNHGYGGVATGGVGSRATAVTDVLSEDYHAFGDFIVGADGGKGELVYAVTHIAETNPHDRYEPGSCSYDWLNCTFRVSTGGIWRLAGHRATRIPNSQPAAMISLAAPRLAYVPADRAATDANGIEVRAAANAPVEIIDITTGRRITSFKPEGRIRALALSERIAAVLVQKGRGTRLELYDPASGAQLRQRATSAAPPTQLTASGTRVAYACGRAIRLYDATTGRETTAATADYAPTNLALDGTRLSWVENRRPPKPFEYHPGPGRIRFLVVPDG